MLAEAECSFRSSISDINKSVSPHSRIEKEVRHSRTVSYKCSKCKRWLDDHRGVRVEAVRPDRQDATSTSDRAADVRTRNRRRSVRRALIIELDMYHWTKGADDLHKD